MTTQSKKVEKSTFEKIKDYAELYNVLPTYVATSLFDFSNKELLQVNLTTFLRCIYDNKHVPDEEKDNILILQGGIVWFSKSA